VYTLGSPFPSTTWTFQPSALPASTVPATSSAQAVAWLQEMATTFLFFCAATGVVGPIHVVGQWLAAITAALALAIVAALVAPPDEDDPLPDAVVELAALDALDALDELDELEPPHPAASTHTVMTPTATEISRRRLAPQTSVTTPPLN
jgi:hypothetical protein